LPNLRKITDHQIKLFWPSTNLKKNIKKVNFTMCQIKVPPKLFSGFQSQYSSISSISNWCWWRWWCNNKFWGISIGWTERRYIR